MSLIIKLLSTQLLKLLNAALQKSVCMSQNSVSGISSFNLHVQLYSDQHWGLENIKAKWRTSKLIRREFRFFHRHLFLTAHWAANKTVHYIIKTFIWIFWIQNQHSISVFQCLYEHTHLLQLPSASLPFLATETIAASRQKTLVPPKQSEAEMSRTLKTAISALIFLYVSLSHLWQELGSHFRFRQTNTGLQFHLHKGFLQYRT